MLTWKICIIGAFAVGKTSLVKQFIHSIFSDEYLSTVGVKISKKCLSIGDRDATLMVWDMEGKDTFTNINTSYLRGASAFFVVADCTRKETLADAKQLITLVKEHTGDVPFYLLINKTDLEAQNELTDEDFAELDKMGIPYFKTSAKTGQCVEEAFQQLACKISEKR